MHKIRTSLLTTTAVLAFTGASYAADMGVPRKAPAPYAPPPAFSWTGFYVGIAGGAGWGTVEHNLNSISGISSSSPFTTPINLPIGQNQINGWLFGGTVGYNWQAAPWLVLGIEGDYDWTDFNGTNACGPFNVFSCNDKVNWTADIAGRVGFVVDRALVYAKGGVAWAHSTHTFSFSSGLGGIGFGPGGGFSTSASDTRTGALLGAGVEYAFLPNWSAKIEYNFMDFGSKNDNFPLNITTGGSSSVNNANVAIKEKIHTVKVGVNYRFNWGQ